MKMQNLKGRKKNFQKETKKKEKKKSSDPKTLEGI